VRALQASGGQFKVRALSRNPGKHRELAGSWTTPEGGQLVRVLMTALQG